MNTKLIALTTESIEFLRNIGCRSTAELFPPGTMVEIDPYEMEANPNFFHVSITDTDGRIHAYVNRSQVTPA